MTAAEPRSIVVVGGSIAALSAVGALEAGGFGGRATMISAEVHPPYTRVPLSKGSLIRHASGRTDGGTALPLPSRDVELVLGDAALQLDTAARLVRTRSGTDHPYDGLVLATGARARRLAAPGQRGELVVRDLDDARLLAARVAGARSVAIVGAGFLGVELASTCRSLGLEVTVVDSVPPLERVLGTWLAEQLVAAAVAAGVRFVLSSRLATLVGDPVTAVDAGDAGTVHADVVVTAAGDIPNSEWLRGSLPSGAFAPAGGVLVDDCARLSYGELGRSITAAGDVAAPLRPDGTATRRPHWTNAVEQGRAAALALIDPQTPPYRPDDYFWTEQFGSELKVAGHLPFRGSPDIDGNLLSWPGQGAATLGPGVKVLALKRRAAALLEIPDPTLTHP